MLEDNGGSSERRQVLSDLRRMTKIVMDDLEDGSRRRLLDAKEIRLLGSMVMRSTRLWLEAHDKTTPESGETATRTGQEADHAVGKD